jgi:hypothetical protein
MISEGNRRGRNCNYYEAENAVLGGDAMWLLIEPTFRRNISVASYL